MIERDQVFKLVSEARTKLDAALGSNQTHLRSVMDWLALVEVVTQKAKEHYSDRTLPKQPVVGCRAETLEEYVAILTGLGVACLEQHGTVLYRNWQLHRAVHPDQFRLRGDLLGEEMIAKEAREAFNRIGAGVGSCETADWAKVNHFLTLHGA